MPIPPRIPTSKRELEDWSHADLTFVGNLLSEGLKFVWQELATRSMLADDGRVARGREDDKESEEARRARDRRMRPWDY